MTPDAARRAADPVIVAVALFLAASLFLTPTGPALSGDDEADSFYIAAMAFGAGIYLRTGRLIEPRQPSNTIGWLLLAVRLIAGLAFVPLALAEATA